ncbi:MAG: 1-(5-phosphoribosyl)-5-[(5-phosphoribosylamino)methylideneamino]imidazole-4-carboxamide isomerase [Flavobacteriales bacterium]
MIIIPAIDIIDGKCVRLTKGDYDTQKVYNEDPLEEALRFEQAGIKHLHLVDLDGAKASHIVNWKVLERISSKTNLHIDFGGGIKTDSDIKIAFDGGAKQITAGSIAVKNKELVSKWVVEYGWEKIIIGADVNNLSIAVNGWQEATDVNLFDFLQDYFSIGVRYSICTDIAKDGMLAGPSVDLYEEVLRRLPKLKLIASGGVTTVEDIVQLREAGLYGVIIGKALYEGRIKLKELEKFV